MAYSHSSGLLPSEAPVIIAENRKFVFLSGPCRALQGDPFGAVFHDRIKMSTGGHRLKIEQKFQLLAPGVMPVKHHSIWQRIEEGN